MTKEEINKYFEECNYTPQMQALYYLGRFMGLVEGESHDLSEKLFKLAGHSEPMLRPEKVRKLANLCFGEAVRKNLDRDEEILACYQKYTELSMNFKNWELTPSENVSYITAGSVPVHAFETKKKPRP